MFVLVSCILVSVSKWLCFHCKMALLSQQKLLMGLAEGAFFFFFFFLSRILAQILKKKQKKTRPAFSLNLGMLC